MCICILCIFVRMRHALIGAEIDAVVADANKEIVVSCPPESSLFRPQRKNKRSVQRGR